MFLDVDVSKTGGYQAISKFNSGEFFADVSVIPEPSTLLLLGSALTGLGFARKKLFKKA